MTNIESNGVVTVLSNPDLEPTVLDDILLRVEAGEVLFHPGCFGPMHGWAWADAYRPYPPNWVEQETLYAVWYAGLITIGAPWKKRPGAGNPVWITSAGKAWLAAAPLVGAA